MFEKGKYGMLKMITTKLLVNKYILKFLIEMYLQSLTQKRYDSCSEKP